MMIDFEISRDGVVYRDALSLPDDHTFTDQEIENMKEAKYAAWVAFIEQASQEVIE